MVGTGWEELDLIEEQRNQEDAEMRTISQCQGGAWIGMCAGIVLGMVSAGHAAGTTWTNTVGSGDWGTAANWDGGVPNSTTTAYFTNVTANSYTGLQNTVGAQVATLILSNAGAGSVVLNVNKDVTVFEQGQGRDVTTSGLVVRARSVVEVNNGGLLSVKAYGLREGGMLRVNAGGVFSNNAANVLSGIHGGTTPSSLHVNGGYYYDNSAMRVGLSGNGATLLFNNGATGVFAYGLNVGYGNAANATISNATLSVVGQSLTVGDGSAAVLAQLNVGSGAVVSNSVSMVIGNGHQTSTCSGTGVVSQTGGTFYQAGAVSMGAGSSANKGETAYLNIYGGTFMLANELQMGPATDKSACFLVVSNGVFRHIGSQIRLGISTNATSEISVAEGGYLSATGAVVVGESVMSSTNLFRVTGGAAWVTNAAGTARLYVRNNGTFRMDGGTTTVDRLIMTNVTGSAVLNKGTLALVNGSVSNGAVFVVGDGANAAVLSLNAGGTNRFADGLTFRTNSTMNVSISGTNTTNFGAADVTGTLSFEGASFVTVTLQGYTPQSKDSWLIAHATAVSATLPRADYGYMLDVVDDSGRKALRLRPTPRGTVVFIQ